MATVVGITADKAQEIADASIVSGAINPANGHLILTTGDGTQIDAGVARDDAAMAAEVAARNAAILVETNNRVADVNAEESARIAAINAITMPTPLMLSDGSNFTFTNTTESATSGGVSSIGGTIIVPATGRLLITVSAILRCTSGNPGTGAWIGFELRQTNVSGTIISPFDPNRGVVNEDQLTVTGSHQILYASLTPGATIFIRLMHRVDSGAAGICRYRRLVALGC